MTLIAPQRWATQCGLLGLYLNSWDKRKGKHMVLKLLVRIYRGCLICSLQHGLVSTYHTLSLQIW